MIFELLINWFGVDGQDSTHPWIRDKDPEPEQEKQKIVVESGVEFGTWGPREDVAMIFDFNQETKSPEWELQSGSKKLPKAPSGLTEYDFRMIRKLKFSEDTYRTIRNYVLQGKRNVDIVKDSGFKKSTVNKLVPRIKDAIKEWQKNPTPTPTPLDR